MAASSRQLAENWLRYFSEQGGADKFRPKWSKYILEEPTPKQRAALLLPHREVFYGGAAGGGKSSWLLMAALQYVDVPGYSALILRRTLKDARNPNSILFRAALWLSHFEEVAWDADTNSYLFPTGGDPAVLQFGYLEKEGHKQQYDSAEYQFCGFDELTHFKQDQYEYLFSRLRGPKCPDHEDFGHGIRVNCPQCLRFGPLSRVPLRMRSASNPGSRGHFWVKERFGIQAIPGKKGPTGKQLYGGTRPNRPMVPSFLNDNPFIDQAEYRAALRHIDDPVTREQKEAGDWGITEDGRFKRSWIRRFEVRGAYINLASRAYELSKCLQFIVVDSASSTKSAPGGTELTNKRASHTAIGRFLQTPDYDLCLMHVVRFQDEMPAIEPGIREVMAGHPVRFVGLEYTTQSIFLYQHLQRKGLPMKPFVTGGRDKIQRAFDATTRMEGGKIWLPMPGAHWLQDFEDEIFTWTGHPEEPDDQVDILSYAAIHLTDNEPIIGSSGPTLF